MAEHNERERVIGCGKMEEHAYLFQSRKNPEKLFVAVCADRELAHLRAQKAIGPDINFYGDFRRIEKQAALFGGKMELTALGRVTS